MKIAIPLTEGKMCMHFGHCEEFALVEVDLTSKEILTTDKLQPPPHEPGVLPRWLHKQGAEVIIAGGMGQRALQLFAQNNIEVVVGAPTHTPDELVTAYLDGTLKTGQNVCDH
ncbi:NifB/NifX family molybdenum-iron cluster-binding protein [Planctomycetota bacterium]